MVSTIRRTMSCGDTMSVKDKDVIEVKQKTKLQAGRLVYDWEWEIPGFDNVFPNALVLLGNRKLGMRMLRSDKVSAGEDIDKKSEWQFQVSSRDGKMSWRICLLKIGKNIVDSVNCAFEMKLVDISGRDLLCRSGIFKDVCHPCGYGWSEVIEIEKLWEEKEKYLQDNTLRMQIVMEMFRDPAKRADAALKQKHSEFALLMTQDMCKLRRTGSTADMTIECNGKAFPAHRLILSARSKVFARMFESQTSAETSKIIIEDVDSFIMEILLDYIYSGVVRQLQDAELIGGLIKAADKYELTELKSFCFNTMAKYISEENIGPLAVLAHRHNAEKGVKTKIESFCRANLENLMKRRSFRSALKLEPDAFFGEECDDP